MKEILQYAHAFKYIFYGAVVYSTSGFEEVLYHHEDVSSVLGLFVYDNNCPCATSAKEKDPHLDLGSWVGSSDGRTVTAKSLRAATAAALVSVISFCLSEKCKRSGEH